MPQIFPMNWILLSIIIFLTIMTFMTHLYFISFNNLNIKNKEENHTILMTFKW
nr:ATP synthase F0 subunit 8 [Dermacentor albipictus]UXG58621.1 ATP synthase F0 subunit 8 [Dermacentor albipictus]UXG58660.1 ATP synthase F0 subunit 8 [Dermacentor albipictus]UYB78031.1 ATP synthase F0 subunit 8 [Dermacentor albipictus]UYB78044.1 ATP synthase F0 subunit 8 [Dermacentor albipictus]